jgi:hypothetical protein
MKKTLPLLCLLVFVLVPQTASARAPNPLTAQMGGLAGHSLDSYRYDFARRCTGRAQRGTLALQSWLGEHVRGVTWGIYSCRRTRSGSSMSLHAEGRAVDWHLDVGKAADRAAANRLVSAFLAPDAAGRPAAMARRMGVQEIIWNCRVWSTRQPAAGMRPYSVCGHGVSRTMAHKDHLHIGLNWRGARERSSFWRLAETA